MRKLATRSWLIALAALALHLSAALATALLAPFPNGFDELQHTSFVRWEAEHPSLLPHYEAVPTLTKDGSAWSRTPNYLNHPAPYYLALSVLDGGRDWRLLRFADVALSTLALAIMLLAGFRLLASAAQQWAYAAALVLFPKLPLIGGIVNNDNAALFAAALFLLALALWREKPRPWLMAAALALCGWTKFTVYLMALFALGIYARLQREKPSAVMLPVCAGAAIGAIPTLVNLGRYGAPLWHPSNFYLPPTERFAWGFLEYAGFFFYRMLQSWPVIEKVDIGSALGLALAFLAAAAIWGRRPRGCAVARALTLALPPTLLLHLWFGWQSFRADGYIWAAQARYYYPLWPGFALALAYGWDLLKPPLRLAAPIVAASLLLAASAPATLLVMMASGRPSAAMF
jgi:hypothetical protein